MASKKTGSVNPAVVFPGLTPGYKRIYFVDAILDRAGGFFVIFSPES